MNAGLRGHQFVKEGAEEGGEGGVFPGGRVELSVHGIEDFNRVLLMSDWWQGYHSVSYFAGRCVADRTV